MKVHTTLDTLHNIRPVVTTGIFDGVHQGHQQLLKTLLEKAQELSAPSVVITFWPHPYAFFNPEDIAFKLLMTIEEKTMKLGELGIDHLLILPFDAKLSALSAEEFVREILIDGLNTQYFVVGDDHRFGKGREGTYTYLKELSDQYGFGLSELGTFASGETRISSTFVRSCLNAGDLASANKLLGYYYFILGEVISGKRLGSKIGFPTANINCGDDTKQIPHDGVYVVTVQWNGHCFGGMLNIGTRPTVDDTGRKSIEVHMFGHEGDLYDQKLQVSFIRKLREEMRFNSLEELKAQLEKDKKNSLTILTELQIITKNNNNE